MKKLLLLTAVFTCLMIKSNAQNYIPYYNLINEAEYKIYQHEYEEAISLIRDAFKVEQALPKDNYLLAATLAKVNPQKNEQEIRSLIMKASKNGNIKRWMSEENIDIEFSEEFINGLIKNSKRWSENNKHIGDTIKYFVARDQEYRKVFTDSIMVYFDEESEEYKSYWHLVERNDSIIQLQFLNYIKENGYPGTYKSNRDIAGVILQHINEDLLDQFDTVLYKEIKKGNIYPYYYGSMMDRINCSLNGIAFYDAHSVPKRCLPSRDQIIENRIKIGMSPHFKGPRKFVNVSRSKLMELY